MYYILNGRKHLVVTFPIMIIFLCASTFLFDSHGTEYKTPTQGSLNHMVLLSLKDWKAGPDPQQWARSWSHPEVSSGAEEAARLTQNEPNGYVLSTCLTENNSIYVRRGWTSKTRDGGKDTHILINCVPAEKELHISAAKHNKRWRIKTMVWKDPS